jgi:hypothetical protein
VGVPDCFWLENVCHDVLERLGDNPTLHQELSTTPVAIQGQRKGAKRFGKLIAVVALTCLEMDEHRARCGKSSGVGKRLVGEEQALLYALFERAKAESAGTVAGRQLDVGRVAILR